MLFWTLWFMVALGTYAWIGGWVYAIACEEIGDEPPSFFVSCIWPVVVVLALPILLVAVVGEYSSTRARGRDTSETTLSLFYEGYVKDAVIWARTAPGRLRAWHVDQKNLRARRKLANTPWEDL